MCPQPLRSHSIPQKYSKQKDCFGDTTPECVQSLKIWRYFPIDDNLCTRAFALSAAAQNLNTRLLRSGRRRRRQDKTWGIDCKPARNLQIKYIFSGNGGKFSADQLESRPVTAQEESPKIAAQTLNLDSRKDAADERKKESLLQDKTKAKECSNKQESKKKEIYNFSSILL